MSSDEKRRFTRINFETELKVCVEDTTIRSTRMRNVSLGGIFIITDKKVPVGKPCSVNIDLVGPSTRLHMELEGEVVRQEEDGIALVFTKTDADSLIYLKHFIRIHADDPNIIDREYYDELFNAPQTGEDK